MAKSSGRRPALVGLGLVAACLLLASVASAAQMSTMTLEIRRQGEPARTMDLVFYHQGDMGQYLLQASTPPGPKVGGYLLTRDAGRTWYAIDPGQGKCAQWTSREVAAVLGGFISRLKNWANLKIEAPHFSKVEERDGEALLGLPTRRYSYLVTFGFKASFLFSSWKYRITRQIDVWATSRLDPFHLRDWLMATPLNTGHPDVDRLINEGIKEVKGMILKKRVREAVTDKDGNTTRSETIQTLTRVGQGPAPAVFSPAWTPPPCQPQSTDQLEEAIKSLLKED